MDTSHFKGLLEQEERRLVQALTRVGRLNPDNAGDWQATPENVDTERADVIDTADNIEEFEEHNAIVVELEARLLEIRNALERINGGTYGVCDACGKKIESDRLEAIPEARTCKAHLQEPS